MNLSRHAVALIALVSTAGSALAQYNDWDPRSPRYPEYQQQQQQQQQQKEQQQEKDKADQQRREEASARDAENYKAFMENQRKLQEKISGDVERDRALFMKTPPVPPQKNPLLGQWRLLMSKKKSGNAITDFNATFAGGVCESVFGDGIWDFRPKAMYGIDDGFGETKLSDVDYRGNEGLIGVIPKSGKLFIFKILGPDRMQELTSTRIRVEPCSFVRVGAGAQGAGAPATASQAANPSPSGGPPAAAGRAPASPPAQIASTASRSSAGSQAAGAVVDGAAFRCADGRLLFVTYCHGNANDTTCTLTELHLPGLQVGKPARRADISARVNGCEAGGIRYGADDKPVFVR